MSDKRKIENETINYSFNRGEKYMQEKWKGMSKIWELSHIELRVMEVGTLEELVSIPLNLQRAFAKEIHFTNKKVISLQNFYPHLYWPQRISYILKSYQQILSGMDWKGVE